MLKFSNGDVLVRGYNDGGDIDPGTGVNNSGVNCFFARYTSTGNMVYGRPLSYNINSISPNSFSWMDMDDNDNFYFFFGGTGIYDLDPAPGVGEITLAGSDQALVKFDSMGNYKWSLVYTGDISMTRIKTTSNNDVIVAGIYDFGTQDLDPGPGVFTAVSSSWYDGFIAKFDSSGNFITAKTFNCSSGNTFFWLTRMEIDIDDNVYLGGMFEGYLDADPGPQSFTLVGSGTSSALQWAFIKLNSNLDFVFGNGFTEGFEINIITDPFKCFYLMGTYTGTVDIDPTSGVTNITTPPNHGCVYIARYDSTANLLWVKTMQTASGFTGTMTNTPYIDDQGLLNFDMHLNDTIVNNGFGFPQLPDNGYSSGGIYMTQIDSSGTCSFIRRLPDGNHPLKTLVADPGHFYYAGRLFQPGDIEIGPGITSSVPISGNEFFLSYYSKDPALNRISGNAFLDINNNNIRDSNEPGLQNLVTDFGTGNLYVTTDNNGNYGAFVAPGNYTISIPSFPGFLTAPVPLVHVANFPTANQIDSLNNFAFGIDSSYVDVSVSLTRFGTARPGQQLSYQLTFTNHGVLPQSGNIIVVLDSILNFSSSSVSPNFINGSMLEWNYSNLLFQQSINFNILVDVNTSALLGDTILSFASITPLSGDMMPNNNADTSLAVVVTSYDPNSKEVSPATAITEAQVAANLDLVYTIRFQNTGNDTAFKVVILDTLSGLLDIATLEIISMSHNGFFALHPGNLMEFRFDNILLPDSNVNEPGSHGFIKYKIRPLNSLLMGSVIENTAYIYFDFNAPISTNTTITEVVDWLGLHPNLGNYQSSVYPNPFSEILNISLHNGNDKILSLELIDIFGRRVFYQNTEIESSAIDGSALPAGVYFLKMQSRNRMEAFRVVKK